jgi:hypothetical protein
MHGALKGKVPPAYLLCGTRVMRTPTDIQYRNSRALCKVGNLTGYVIYDVIQAGRGLAVRPSGAGLATRRALAHVPRSGPVACEGGRDCPQVDTQYGQHYPVKAKKPGRPSRLLQRSLGERPMTSVERTPAPVTSSALTARRSARGPEMSRG